MSTLVTNNIVSPTGNTLLRSTGNIIQVVTIRSDARSTYSSLVDGNGTTITDLGMTITPFSANSTLICVWHMFYEVHHNNVFLVHRDGVLPTTAGRQGYNAQQGNLRYSGLQAAAFDNATNNTTTPHMAKLTYYDVAGSTAARTYAPAVRGSGATAYTFFLNRSGGNDGADGSETGVSFGRIFEVVA